MLLEVDPIGFRAACMALIDADLVADLPRLAVPTLVICGELDQATPPELNRLEIFILYIFRVGRLK